MRLTDRTYEPSDVKVLMEKTGSARNWDDMLRYLEGPAQEETGLSALEVQHLADDMRDMKEDGIRFTNDYRELWRELTGVRTHVPAKDRHIASTPQGGDSDGLSAELEPRDPSSRVMDVLRRVQSREYREMAGLRDSTRHSSRP